MTPNHQAIAASPRPGKPATFLIARGIGALWEHGLIDGEWWSTNTAAYARTGEGRARAVARGVEIGRKPKLTPHQQKEAIKRRDRGETLSEIGRSYNVSPATISRLMA